MRTTKQILSSYRDVMTHRFLAVVRHQESVPPSVRVPVSPRAALLLGMKLGRKAGYGDGIAEGLQLGLNVGLEAVDAMMSQPVIFGRVASA
jgi:hypothetical protein